MLLVHGTDDTTVPVADAQTIYAQRPGDQVRLLLLAGEHDSTDEIERHMGALLEFVDRATGRKIAVS